MDSLQKFGVNSKLFWHGLGVMRWFVVGYGRIPFCKNCKRDLEIADAGIAEKVAHMLEYRLP